MRFFALYTSLCEAQVRLALDVWMIISIVQWYTSLTLLIFSVYPSVTKSSGCTTVGFTTSALV